MFRLPTRARKGECGESTTGPVRFLLVGPHDPSCGEYTFLAPPLGVWRLAGVLREAGHVAEVFDPNCCDGPAMQALEERLRSAPWDVIGFSTTGMTLRFDLALAHRARRVLPGSLLVAGGMEATFKPAEMLGLGPFDLIVLGEGERPLLEMASRLRSGEPIHGCAGTAWADASGSVQRVPQPAMDREALRDAIFATPYSDMPYRRYWKRLEEAYGIGEMSERAEREARLAEMRAIRLITLNYCPMGCTFCSSTNFLHAAQEGTARIARLDADECIAMVERICGEYPDVRTIIFQDDIFAFRNDPRLLPLCAAIVDAKARESIPRELQFISTNRIDAMNSERLAAMRTAGFRVLGFGIENFSRPVLKEFNKEQIYPHIRPMLSEALRVGITPFLDMILTSPRCTLDDLALTAFRALHWMHEGCEVGIYPWVIPFSGAPLSSDASLAEHTVHETYRIEGTDLTLRQPARILPIAPAAREAILEASAEYDNLLSRVQQKSDHIPSRLRSQIWLESLAPVLARRGYPELAFRSRGVAHFQHDHTPSPEDAASARIPGMM